MENKYSPKTQAEIENVLAKLHHFNELFSINVEYFIDGFALFLDEKNLYPRRIVIFKSYDNNFFSIKSFEVNLKYSQKEEINELYSVHSLDTIEKLIKELKDIIYGKDVMKFSSKHYFNKVSK